MKKIMKKLKNHAGETIAEVLIALLISALGMLMLASMITTSSNFVVKSRKTLETYYSAPWQDKGEKSASITFKSGDGSIEYDTYDLKVTEASKAFGGKTVLSYTKGGTP